MNGSDMPASAQKQADLTALAIYQRLADTRGEPRWWSDDPFIVIFQAVLVQNTAWSSVERTCAAMGEALTLQRVAQMPIEELEAHIRPCGFCKAKARTIKTLLAWYGQYGYDSARTAAMATGTLRRELLSLRGVGAETADVLLVYAFYRPSFIVDTYTRRLLARLGCDVPNDEAIREFVSASVPEDAHVYGWFHWLILEHCIDQCKKVPRCDGCCFQETCRTGRQGADGGTTALRDGDRSHM